LGLREYPECGKNLRKLLDSDPTLLNRFETEYKEANMIQDNSDNINKIIEKYKKEYENKKNKNYKSLLDRLLEAKAKAKGGKKRRQKKLKNQESKEKLEN
jgi:hypothetical protein